MKLAATPETVLERIALACGIVPTPLLDTLVGLLLAKTVMAGSGLGLFEVLEGGALASEDISIRCGTDLRGTEKLLRALVACGYLTWKKGNYALARVSRRWLLPGRPDSLHPTMLLRALDLRAMSFEEYVLNGTVPDFHAKLTPQEWKIYHEGQASHAALVLDEVVNRAPVPPGATQMLDLGGGPGLYSFAFCERHPALRAEVLDLAVTTTDWNLRHVSEMARRRVDFRSADIRTSPLRRASADIVLLANICHHFDEKTNRNLLRRAAEALRAGGVVITIDAVRPTSIENSTQIDALLDLYFGATSGSGLWTIEQIRSWQEAAGLEPMPPISLRLAPWCTMQVATKSSMN